MTLPQINTDAGIELRREVSVSNGEERCVSALSRKLNRRGATDAERQSRNPTERKDRRQKNLETEIFFCPKIFLSIFLRVGTATAGKTHLFPTT
jgi:hypothetical protein